MADPASGEIATLHVPFKKWLTAEGIPFITPRSDRESTIAEGHPDFTLLLAGRALLIEFKTKEGKVSGAQEERKALLEKTGSRVFVLRDLAHAESVVQAWRDTLGEVLPVEQPTAPRPLSDLVRFGASVFRRDPATRSLTHVRVATAADAHLATA